MSLVVSEMDLDGLPRDITLQNMSMSIQPNTENIFIFGGAFGTRKVLSGKDSLIKKIS